MRELRYPTRMIYSTFPSNHQCYELVSYWTVCYVGETNQNVRLHVTAAGTMPFTTKNSTRGRPTRLVRCFESNQPYSMELLDLSTWEGE